MEDITIQDLITEQKNRNSTLQYHDAILPYYDYPDMNSYYKWLEKAKRFIEINYPDDKHIADFEQISKQDIWPNQQAKLLAILEAFAVLPIAISRIKPSPKKQDPERGPAIKDDLTGRQIKELKTVVAEAGNDLQKARPGIIEKLKSFGADVASNIVANLLTNPAIWGGL